MSESTSWADDHVAITGVFSIGSEKCNSLCGAQGSRFWIDHWGYPAIGIYFADCPSAGHDMFCLDYRGCGHTGEPEVVHVDQERDYRITRVAPDFESFVRGLELPAGPDPAEKAADRERLVSGPFPSAAQAELGSVVATYPELGRWIREAFFAVFDDKSHLSIHADDCSRHALDLIFLLHETSTGESTDPEAMGELLETVWSSSDGAGLAGYAPGFIGSWFADRVERGILCVGRWGGELTPSGREAIVERCAARAP